MKTFRKHILLIGLLIIGLGTVQAQKGLCIEQVFKDYGKQEGAILIELAKDVLGDNTRINKYKSLIMDTHPEAAREAEQAVLADVEEGSRMMVSKKDGRIESGYYCLPRKSDSSQYEYILLKNKSDKLTLVYIRGNFPPKDLEKEMAKLKKLFIKVNNKQIKLSIL